MWKDPSEIISIQCEVSWVEAWIVFANANFHQQSSDGSVSVIGKTTNMHFTLDISAFIQAFKFLLGKL